MKNIPSALWFFTLYLKRNLKWNLKRCLSKENNCNTVISFNADILAVFHFGWQNTSNFSIKVFWKTFFFFKKKNYALVNMYNQSLSNAICIYWKPTSFTDIRWQTPIIKSYFTNFNKGKKPSTLTFHSY